MESLFLHINSALWIVWAVYWFAMSRSVNKTTASEGFLLRASHLVPLVAAFILIFNPRLIGLGLHDVGANSLAGAFGDGVTAVGLMFAVWGRVHLGKYWSGIITLKEGHRLIRTGPYRLVRHPLYTGFLAGTLGSAITVHSWEAACGLVLMLIAYVIKIRREEAVLAGQFGDEYMTYRREVRALILISSDKPQIRFCISASNKQFNRNAMAHGDLLLRTVVVKPHDFVVIKSTTIV